MTKNYVNRQIKDANNNFNYFLVRIITLIVRVIFTISVILIINSLISSTLINIISIILTILYGIHVFNKISYYIEVMIDIKNTIPKEEISYEVDIDTLSDNLLLKGFNYGK